MTQAFDDAPHVLVFPPVIPIATVLLAGALQWVHPLGLFRGVPSGPRIASGLALLAVGISFLAAGLQALARGGTSVSPARPALALVDSGVFRLTRNPIYLGGSFVMLGCAFLFMVDWLPLLLGLSLPVLHFGIILPEENYLERKFGDRYRLYRLRVPRYLGPIEAGARRTTSSRIYIVGC